MTEQLQEQHLDEKDLKILAYKEQVGQLYEEVANLRVQLTLLNQAYNEATKPKPDQDDEVEPEKEK